MSGFADEKNHYARQFTAAWLCVGDSAEVLAGKIQRLMRRLAVIEPTYGEVRPILAPRPFRPSDPGPVLDMSVQDLGTIIDRGARLNPPRFPAPVGPDGYSVVLGPDIPWIHPRRVGGTLNGGQYQPNIWDTLKLHAHDDNPVWRQADLALTIIDALIDVLGCQCVSAWAFIPGGDEGGWCRPWMTWVAKGAAPSLPYPFPFPDAPPAERMAEYREGELRTWS